MSTKLLIYTAWITTSIILNSMNAVSACTDTNIYSPTVQTTPTVKTESSEKSHSATYILGHCDPDEEFNGIGWEAPRFSCAIKITKDQIAQIEGASLKAIRLQMKNTTKTSGFKIWIKSDLESSPIIEQAISTPTPSQWCSFNLDTPYQISGKEFFIGYSFEMGHIETTEDKLPIGIYANSHPEGTYLYTDDYGWMNFSSRFGSLAIQGIVELPADFSTIDVSLHKISPFRILKASTKALKVDFTNLGQETVENLEVSYFLGNKRDTFVVSEIKPIEAGRQGTFILPVEAPSQADETSLTIQVVKVNGKVDPFLSNNSTQCNVTILSNLAQHKVLIEEGTGCWCQWCPRGAVALKLIKEKFSDKAIGIAVHASDELSSKDYENLAFKMQQNSGFPTALINRTTCADPYYGLSKENFGISTLIDSLSAIPAIADIEVTGTVKADKDDFYLEVSSQTTFYSNIHTNSYTVAYAILENGLTGKQANGYSGKQNLPEELAYLSELSLKIRDFPMNDVARRLYPNTEIFIPLPGTITDGNVKTHSHIFKLSPEDFKNLENLEVVAILMNTNGIVENCNISPVSSLQTDITQTAAPYKPQVEVEYGILHVHHSGNAELQVYTTDGTLVFHNHINNDISIGLSNRSGIHIVHIIKDGQHFTSKVTI